MTNGQRKLKKDAIVEALFEMRFNSTALPELYIGRLASEIASLEEGMSIQRLPIADLPAPLRRADPSLAYQPTLQAQNKAGSRLARVGETVISWHVLGKYPGWPVFQPEIASLMARVEKVLEGASLVRLGLRYLNFFKTNDHFVEGVKDLSLDVAVNGTVIDYPIAINYHRDFPNHRLATKIATREFIEPRPEDVSLLVDIDVHTDERPCPQIADALRWVEEAHSILEDEFFNLLKPEIMKKLVEE
jgi:uncharacterized protein (TIGR04255 family)